LFCTAASCFPPSRSDTLLCNRLTWIGFGFRCVREENGNGVRVDA